MNLSNSSFPARVEALKNSVNTVFVLIEMADVEIISIQTFDLESRDLAIAEFEAMAEENAVFDAVDMDHELYGCIRLAGDDAYSVALYVRPVLREK